MLTHDMIFPGTAIVTSAGFWPESVLKEVRQIPLPNARLVAISRDDFPKACKAIGINPNKVSLHPTSYEGFYRANFSRAWVPPAALWHMSRTPVAPTAGQSRLRGLREQAQNMLSRLTAIGRRLKRLRKGNPADARIGKEYDDMLNHPDVEKIHFTDRHIVVTTGDIKIHYNTEDKTSPLYRLGRFELTWPTDGSFSLSIKSLDNLVPGYSHPNVTGTTPCMGNARPDFERCCMNRQHSAMLGLVIQYLHAWNPDDRYRPLDKWPRARQ